MASQPEVGVSDFVLLDNLTTDKFIENLHLRFQHNKIYTNIGEVLVSVNPYKTLDIYGAATMMQYRGREMFEVPPHVYAVADACQRVLRQQGRDTCVLISGESGSGKTEASKFIMKYIAANTTENQREYIDRIKNVLIQSNAILETFGNAKTNRNDNSSRFGKYMDIHFSAGGDPAGGHVSNYLLEKSRVVAQQPGERNFHAFYQLLSSSKASKLGLAPSTQYQFLGPGRPTTQDGQLFAATNSAFNALGFPKSVVDEIWSIVAAVVLLGELTFSETPDGNLHIGGPLSQCVSSLGISASSLQACMAGRVLCAGGELVSKQHSLHDAAATRHALAKAAYDRLFAWIVQQINKAIDVPTGTHASSVIGVLDIYGFEIFDTNSFEQFCINYCNEKLQQLFIELVLKQEQEEYSREGITWTPVAYFNNRVICELIDAPHQGIIAIMDEACLNPTKISDRQLLEAMDKRLSGHKHYTSRQLAPTDKKLQHGVDFRITHYAGEVTYAITNFMDKNQDSLWQDLKRLLHSSTNASLKDMWPEGGTTIQKTSKRPPSAATLFRNSMQALVQGLLSKEPFYVRCVKPNPRQAPNSWDEQLVRHQVSYLGLVENVRVRRAGFASRQRYDRFLRRYKMLSQYTWPNYRGTSDKEAVLVLLRDLAVTDFQAGHTKLFIRSAKTVHQLETARAELIPSIVVLLQKLWRGALARQRYRKMKAALRIFHAWRRYRSRRYIAELQTELARNRGLIRHWPPPPRGARVACLPPAYRRWRAYLTLKPIPRDQWPQLKMKICAASALKGRRREWGARRQWLGDYLAQDSYNSKAVVPNMEPVPGPSHGSVPVPDRDGGTPPRRRRRRRRVSSSSSSSSCSSSSSDTCSSAKRSKRSRRHRRKKSKHESRTDQRMDQLFKELGELRKYITPSGNTDLPCDGMQDNDATSVCSGVSGHLYDSVAGSQDLDQREESPKLTKDFTFSLETKLKEPSVPKTPDVFLKMLSDVQRLGSTAWSEVRYADTQKTYNHTPGFIDLETNEEVKMYDTLRNQANTEKAYAAITYCVLKQKEALQENLRNILTWAKDNDGITFDTLNNKIDELFQSGSFHKITSDLLQLVCGHRAESIEMRRDAITTQVRDPLVKATLSRIPPSSTYLFESESFTAALEKAGGVRKAFWPPRSEQQAQKSSQGNSRPSRGQATRRQAVPSRGAHGFQEPHYVSGPSYNPPSRGGYKSSAPTQRTQQLRVDNSSYSRAPFQNRGSRPDSGSSRGRQSTQRGNKTRHRGYKQ